MRLYSIMSTGVGMWFGGGRLRGREPCLCCGSISPGAVIGTVEYLREDKRGLRVIGRISPRTAAGREAAALLKEGAVSGLSFGYRVREASEDRPRELRALDLVEVSLVRFPMQPLARVHAVEE